MKTGSSLFFFFLISVAAILLNQGAVDAAGRVLKKRNIIVTAQPDTIPCDHHNLVKSGVYVEVGDILKNKLPSGPSSGVGHNFINSLGPVKMNTAGNTNTLKMNKLPSGPSPGVGHKYINAAGKASPQRLITTTPLNKLPSGPSGPVGHKRLM